ncbi:MAG TPA: hypothetical protein VF116_06860 [Ktedonobacterales bacterium]
MTRAPEEVREKALEVAVAKYDEGCESCSQSYLDLARRNGATEVDVRRAGMGRRGFLKLAALVFGAAATASTAALVGPHVARAFAQQLASPGGFFGVDSCTSLTNAIGASMPVQFYIAEIGAGANGLNCLDPDTAAQVGPDYTHGYWGLCGPNYALDPTNPYAYGRQQALDALQALAALPSVNGRTLFADVEYGFGGWADGASQAQHAAVLDGFLETVAAAQLVPGVYINNSSRDDWFPAGYTPRVPFVYWVAGGEWAGTMCAPCDDACNTLTPTRDAWNHDVSQANFGGQYAALWQYWLSDFGCSGDFNFSPQSGYQAFTPLSSPARVPTPAGSATPGA